MGASGGLPWEEQEERGWERRGWRAQGDAVLGRGCLRGWLWCSGQDGHAAPGLGGGICKICCAVSVFLCKLNWEVLAWKWRGGAHAGVGSAGEDGWELRWVVVSFRVLEETGEYLC